MAKEIYTILTEGKEKMLPDNFYSELATGCL
jgi:hypothetical protein